MKNLQIIFLVCLSLNLLTMQKGLAVSPFSLLRQAADVMAIEAPMADLTVRGNIRNFLALPDALQQIIVYEYLKKNQNRSFEWWKTLAGHTGWVRSVINITYKFITSGSIDGIVRIWDINSGKCIQVLEGHTRCVNSVIKITDTLIASGSSDRTVRIWDINSGKCTQILEGHVGWVSSVIKLTDTLIATGSDDKTLRIWDISSGRCIQVLKGHAGWVSSVTKLTDKLIATVSDVKH